MEAAQTHAYGIAGIHPGAAIPQEGLREVAAILHLKLLFWPRKAGDEQRCRAELNRAGDHQEDKALFILQRRYRRLPRGGQDIRAAIAQLGERQTEDLKVPSSIPVLGMPCAPPMNELKV